MVAIACFAAIAPGYEPGERSSLGKRGERRLWRKKRPERSAAVDKIEEKRKPENFIEHRKPAAKPRVL